MKNELPDGYSFFTIFAIDIKQIINIQQTLIYFNVYNGYSFKI